MATSDEEKLAYYVDRPSNPGGSSGTNVYVPPAKAPPAPATPDEASKNGR
jgi:hypothetical protein